MPGSEVADSALAFARRKGLKVFYTIDLPDYPVILWDSEKGGLREFLALFEDEELEDPIIVWDRGVCVRLNGVFYCHTKHPAREEAGEAQHRAEPKEPMEPTLYRERVEGERLAEALVSELAKRDPRTVARELVDRMYDAVVAIRSPYQLVYALANYIIETGGVKDARIHRLHFYVVERLRSVAAGEMREFMERLISEIENIIEEEAKKRIDDALEKCLSWMKKNRILKPKRSDFERCLIEESIRLRWSEKEALWSKIKRGDWRGAVSGGTRLA